MCLRFIFLFLCAGNDQLKKKVLEAGEGRDSRPEKGQNVKIHLKTSLADGTLVEEQSELSFTLGDGDVIQVRKKCGLWNSVPGLEPNEIFIMLFSLQA